MLRSTGQVWTCWAPAATKTKRTTTSPSGSRKGRVMADLDNEAVRVQVEADVPYDWIGGRYEKPLPPKWKRHNK